MAALKRAQIHGGPTMVAKGTSKLYTPHCLVGIHIFLEIILIGCVHKLLAFLNLVLT